MPILLNTNDSSAERCPLKPSAKFRIPSIDGIRALSIALVLVGHSSSTYSHKSVWANTLLTVFGNAGLGVLIFFVISGFLITTLLLNEYEKKGKINLADFYFRRTYRIFPAFYCYMGVVACLWLLGAVHLSWPVFGMAAIFLRDYASLITRSHPTGDWFVGHTWTLSVEEQFYWLWPLCLVRVKPKYAVVTALLLVVLTPILRTAEYLAVPKTRDLLPIMLHTRMDSLMAGSLAALLYKDERFQLVLKRLYFYKIPILAALLTFFVFPFLGARFRGMFYLPVGWTLENLGVVLVLLWAIDHPTSKVGLALNGRMLVHIGIISYSLYLWQQLFLTDLTAFFWNRFPLNLLFTLLAAELSYFAVEKPVLTWRNRTAAKAS